MHTRDEGILLIIIVLFCFLFFAGESESILRPVLTSPAGHKPEQHLRPTLPPVHRAKRSKTTQAPTTKPSADMGKIYQVVVHGLRGEKLMIDLCNTEEQMKSMTVRQLKEKIAERLPGDSGERSGADSQYTQRGDATCLVDFESCVGFFCVLSFDFLCNERDPS